MSSGFIIKYLSDLQAVVANSTSTNIVFDAFIGLALLTGLYNLVKAFRWVSYILWKRFFRSQNLY